MAAADHIIQTTLADINPGFPVREETPVMHVRKRNGALEPVDVNKIVRAVQRSSYGLSHVDAIRVASKTIGGLYDGATTRELDAISIDTAASLIAEEPQYSRLAARLHAWYATAGRSRQLVFDPLCPGVSREYVLFCC